MEATFLVCESGGMDAGFLVEGIDLEAGIVCEGPKGADPQGVSCFDEGIFFKAVAVFFGDDTGKAGDGDDVLAVGCEKQRNFANFSDVMARDNEGR